MSRMSAQPHERERDNFHRAVFLDRDGTLNLPIRNERDKEDSPLRPEDVVLSPGAGDFTRRLRDAGYLTILATNQSAAAKGRITLDGLEQIHKQLLDLLAQEGGGLDHIYYCPHYPKGVSGSYSSLVRVCGCRKPAPGMLFRAAADWDLDLSRSWMVGDSLRDAQAGHAAGCRTILLADLKPDALRSLNKEWYAHYIAPSLPRALEIILGEDARHRALCSQKMR
jgi:histidinol-phosphate phosphatase family protein